MKYIYKQFTALSMISSPALSPSLFRSLQHLERIIKRNFSINKREPCSSDEVIHILETVRPIEDGLETIASRITADVITSVIQKQGNPQVGFRLFIWSVKKKRLCRSVSRDFVVDMLVRDNAFELYWETLRELKNSAIAIASDAFLVLMKAYSNMGMAEKAVESFVLMKDFDCEPNIFAYNLILHVLVQNQLFLLALAVYNQMLKCSYHPNVATYNILIDGFCKASNIEDALTLFDEMTKRVILPNEITYSIIISGFCRVKKINDAWRLFNKMKASGFEPDVITYNALLYGLCKVGYFDEAFALLKSYEKASLVVGVIGYSCLIDGLFRARRYDEAHFWYQKMLIDKIKPDVHLYTIMINGLFQEGRVKDALKLLGEMTERGLNPDTCCYNAVIKGLCDFGLLDEAQSLKLEISKHNCFPNNYTYTILICGMCKNGLIGEAQRVFNEMEKFGCLPSVVTFNSLIDGLCKAGKLEEARFLFHKMEIGRKPSLFLRLSQGASEVPNSTSLQSMIAQLCESGLILKAYKLLMVLVENGVVPDVRTYNILINGFCKAEKIDDAFKLFKDMQLKGRLPDSVTYGTLIDGLYRVDRDEDAIKVFDQMVNNGCIPESAVYKAIMTWSCRKNNVSYAFGVWLKYLRNANGWEDEKVKVVAEFFDKGEIEKAIRMLIEMEFKSRVFDPAPYSIFLNGMCQAQKASESFTIFSILKEFKTSITPASCVVLIGLLCREEKPDLAMNVFLYTLERGFILTPKICNQLLRHLQDRHDTVSVLIRRMEAFGYNLDEYLDRDNKLLIYDHLKLLNTKAVMANNFKRTRSPPS